MSGFKSHTVYGGPRGLSGMNANIIEAEHEAARRKAAAIEQERAYERRLKEYAESLAAFVRDMDTAFDGVEGYRGVSLRQIHDALGREQQGDTIAALAIAGIYPDGRVPASYSFNNLAFNNYDFFRRVNVHRRYRRAEGSVL